LPVAATFSLKMLADRAGLGFCRFAMTFAKIQHYNFSFKLQLFFKILKESKSKEKV
jgi:hypothetical protein